MSRRAILRLVPWFGATLVALGALQVALTVIRGSDGPGFRVLGTGLLVCGGGIGLIARAQHGSRRLAFIALGLGAGLGAALWASG
jgi:hypothetical protein